MRFGWVMVAEERSLARSAAFSGFIYTQQNPALEVLPTPAHPQVTQTVGRLLRLIINILAHIKLPKENRLTDEKVEKRNY
jgi:hypothetical protein